METLRIIQQELKAPKNQKNSFGNYNYRSCEDILEALKPLLDKQKATIVINDELVNIGDRYYVKSTATLSDGQTSISATAFAREEETKKGMDAAQITGAASSYARKYALNGLFAIDDTKDADSQDNSKQPVRTVAKENVPKPVNNLATEAQVKLLLARARDFSGLADKDAVVLWFTEKTGVAPNMVKKADVDEMLKLLEEERDV